MLRITYIALLSGVFACSSFLLHLVPLSLGESDVDMILIRVPVCTLFFSDSYVLCTVFSRSGRPVCIKFRRAYIFSIIVVRSPFCSPMTGRYTSCSAWILQESESNSRTRSSRLCVIDEQRRPSHILVCTDFLGLTGFARGGDGAEPGSGFGDVRTGGRGRRCSLLSSRPAMCTFRNSEGSTVGK